MPKLTDERRQRIEAQHQRETDFWARIEAKYHTKQKRHAECRLCGEMVTAIEPADVFAALKEHEATHPEYAEWVRLGQEYDIRSIHEIFHDHDCVYAKCACICGHEEEWCVADLPPEKQTEPMLCPMCELYQDRGHVEHRLPTD